MELPYHVRDAVDLDSFRIQQIFEGSIQLEREDGTVRGISAEVGLSHEDEKELLSAIVEGAKRGVWYGILAGGSR